MSAYRSPSPPRRPAAGPATARTSGLTPAAVHAEAGRLVPAFAAIATVSCVSGLAIGFFADPARQTALDSLRIVYLHLPALWVAVVLYLAFLFWSALGWWTRQQLATMAARAVVPTGAIFGFLAIWTGSLGGKPASGTWWTWDPRVCAIAVLVACQVAWLLVQTLLDSGPLADRLGASLAVAGLLLALAVQSWVPAPVGLGAPAWRPVADSLRAGTTMHAGMLVTAFGFWAYSVAIVLWRLRALILEAQRQSTWAVGQPARHG